MNGSGHCSDRSTHPLFLVARRGLHQGCHAESWTGEFKIQIYSFYMNKLLPPFITKWLFDYPEKSQFENPHPQKQLLPCICTFCHRFQIHSPFSPQIARTELPENMKNDIMILVSNLMQQEQNKKNKSEGAKLDAKIMRAFQTRIKESIPTLGIATSCAVSELIMPVSKICTL